VANTTQGQVKYIVFATRLHPECCILSYSTSIATVLLLIGWFYVGGLQGGLQGGLSVHSIKTYDMMLLEVKIVALCVTRHMFIKHFKHPMRYILLDVRYMLWQIPVYF